MTTMLADKLVANTRQLPKMSRMGGVTLQFASQSQDMIIHGPSTDPDLDELRKAKQHLAVLRDGAQ
jgi:hypothetical protein